MKPRNTVCRPCRHATAGLVLGVLWALLPLTPAHAQEQGTAQEEERTFPHAGDARLLSSDEAAPIKHTVIGLQRTAIPLGWGFAVDTALLADAALAANVGVRWGVEFGPNRLVLGARYTQFLGNSVLSKFVTSQEPIVKTYDVTFRGPSFYALYGLALGSRLLVQVEGRYSNYQTVNATVTAAAVFNFAGRWSVVGELGVRINKEGLPLRGAAGLRYGGENLGLSLGVVYADLTEPMLPVNSGKIPFIPALDLSWTFQ